MSLTVAVPARAQFMPYFSYRSTVSHCSQSLCSQFSQMVLTNAKSSEQGLGHKHSHRHHHDKRVHDDADEEKEQPAVHLKPKKIKLRPATPPPPPSPQPAPEPVVVEEEKDGAAVEEELMVIDTEDEEKKQQQDEDDIETDAAYAAAPPELIPTADAAPAETDASRYGLGDDDIEEADLAAAEEKATSWSSATAVVENKEENQQIAPLLTDEQKASALLKNKGADISLRLARRLHAESCYYSTLKERGDLGIYTFQTVNEQDGSAYQHVGCKQIHQSFNMVITNFNNSLFVLTPISLLVHHLALPLGSINSDYEDISRQKCESIKISGGVGVTRGLPLDSLDGYNIRALDCLRWVAQEIEMKALAHLRIRRPEVYANQGERCSDLVGTPPTWYFQHRLFRQLSAKKTAVSQPLAFVHQMYWNTEKKYDEKQLYEARKKGRLHRKLYGDVSVRDKELVVPSVWRFPMKPEAETEPRDSHRLIPLTANEQASLPEFGGAVMMLLTPDSLCLPPPKAKRPGLGPELEAGGHDLDLSEREAGGVHGQDGCRSACFPQDSGPSCGHGLGCDVESAHAQSSGSRAQPAAEHAEPRECDGWRSAATQRDSRGRDEGIVIYSYRCMRRRTKKRRRKKMRTQTGEPA